jgi:hypothetical protein
VADTTRRDLKVLVGTMHLTLTLLLAQAILAGFFVSDVYSKNNGGDSLVTTHGVVADAVWVVALLATAYCVVKLHRSAPALMAMTGAYFVLALVETGIGHLISDDSLLGISGNRNGLIAAHIPIAIVLFALGGFTPLQSDTLGSVARRLDTTPMAVALAWLLQRSPNLLLIPGTSSLDHLRENVAGAGLALSADDLAELDGIAS